jgi:hypothetical protein
MGIRSAFALRLTAHRRVAAILALAAPMIGCNNLIGNDEIDTEGEGANAGRQATPDDVQGGPLALNCAYAPDPASIGTAKDKYLSAAKNWQGWKAGTTDFSSPATINATDFYDCNGSKGVHAIVFEMAKFF